MMKTRPSVSRFLILFVLLSFLGGLTEACAYANQRRKHHKNKHSKHKHKHSRSSVTASSQSKDPQLEAADMCYNHLEYFMAAQKYQKVVEKDPMNKYATYMLAESYRKHFNYDQAQAYYKRTVEIALKKYPMSRYWYAFMLMSNEQYKEAKQQFEQFLKEYKASNLKTETDREMARQAINNCNFAMESLNTKHPDFGFTLLPAPVNSENSDYAAVIGMSDSSIVITSSRKGAMGKQIYPVLGGDYSDNFRFEKTNSGWETVNNRDGFSLVNTTFHESAGSYTNDRNKFYFTRCDEKMRTNHDDEIQCAIYVSEMKDGVWQKAVKLNDNINAKGQWNAQPAVSPDGKILFFVSKRPGGYGMSDIWYSVSTGGDNWGKAVNLGPAVNTISSEMSPVYYAENKALFFSSDGHSGFGGLDVFVTLEENEFEKIQNIGAPFNSGRDDFSFSLGAHTGYVSSNRSGGLGNDDIYSFTYTSTNEFIDIIAQRNTNEDLKLLTEGEGYKKSPFIGK